MKNEKIINALNKLDPSKETEDEIFNTISRKQNKLPHSTGRISQIFYKPAAVISIMLCFAIVVSATAIMINQHYIPFKGFVNSEEYEVYYTPEILTLGKYATVETITRVKDGKTSELSIIITDMLDKNLKIITENHGEFKLTPIRDYNYSSFGTMTAFSFDKEGDYSSYGYYIKDFPEINEFTLVNGNESTEVKLVPSNSGGVVITEDSGVKIKSYSMSKGSKVFAYEIEDNNFDFERILGVPEYTSVSTIDYINSDSFIGHIPDSFFEDMMESEFILVKNYNKEVKLGSGAGTFKLYDENGNKMFFNGYDSSVAPNGLDTTMFLRIRREDKINKLAVDSVTGSIDTYMLPNNFSIEDVPIPADGEEIIFDGGLLLYDLNGLTCKAESVTRKGNEVTIYTNTEYTGEDIDNIENIDIYMQWHGGLGIRAGGWVDFTTFKIKGDEEFIKLYMDSIRYTVKGNWEIAFD